MRRFRVAYRAEAIDDLEEIFGFILEISRDRDIARGFVGRLRDRCERVGNVPFGGTARDDLMPGIRTVSFERRAVIAYRIVDTTVEITNIFYGGRDFEAVYRGRAHEENEPYSS